MRSKTIKRSVGIGAGALAAILAVGAVVNSVMPAYAEETLFGIETLIQEVQSRQTPYRILEIVPDEKASEIGYYIPGYEPVLSTREAGTGEWSDWVEGLKEYRTAQERTQYMEDLNTALEEFYALRGFSGNNKPVTYEKYEESADPKGGYTQLVFDEEVRKGYYKPYTGTEGVERYNLDFYYAGDYDEEAFQGELTTQYYYVEGVTPITYGMLENLDDSTVLYCFIDQLDAYRFEEAGTWAELKGLFEGEEETLPETGDAGSVSGNNPSVSGNGSEGDTGSVSGGDIDPNEPTDYYQITMKNWQQGETPAYTALYGVENIVIAQDGAFEFVELGEEEAGFESTIQRAPVYYKGGFINNVWLHTNVLNMLPEEAGSFPIEVITLTASELSAMTALPEFDMLYLNSGMQSFVIDEETGADEEAAGSGAILPYSNTNDISDVMRLNLFKDVVVWGKPCIVDSALVYNTNAEDGIEVNAELQETAIFRLAVMFMQKSPTDYYTSTLEANIEEPSATELLNTVVEDKDKNFVVEQTYCFYAPMMLIGPDFTVNQMYKEGMVVDSDAAEGFKVVLDEILSENLNREADASGEYGQLPTNVSQATAVRHVMNYKNRRQIEVKKNLRVLEIQPAKSDDFSYDLTEEEVKSWAPGVETVQIERMTTAEFIGKIEDINENYDLIYIGTDKDSMNVVSGTQSVLGYPFGPVNGNFEGGNTDGWAVFGDTTAIVEDAANGSKYALDLNNITITQVVEVTAGETYSVSAWGKQDGGTGGFGINVLDNAQDDNQVPVEATTFDTDAYEYRSFNYTVPEGKTHIKLYFYGNVRIDDIVVTHLVDTTAESAELNLGSTVFNDHSMDGLIYFHTGDMRYTGMELAGQLNTEYVDGNTANHLYYYNPMRYGGNDITEEKKEALLSFLDASYPIIVSDEMFESAATVYQDIDYGGYSVDLAPGEYTMRDLNARGVKDDDITAFKVSEGYTLTAYREDNFEGEEVYGPTENDVGWLGDWNDDISSIIIEEIPGQEEQRARKISTDHIDNSSYMYQFIQEAMGKSNFYARSDISPDSSMFQFYLNRPKVSLTNVTANGNLTSNGIYDIYPDANGKYTLEYRFTIQNEGAASADTRYECELFIDVNADGKYSLSEELGDVSLTHNGTTVSTDNLYIGREYVLRRTVPDGYKGVLPWKLQISQVNNPHIHNGMTGYTKLRGLESETLKILQICRDPVTEVDWWGGENEVFFNLETKIADPMDIYHILIYGGTYDGVTYEGIYKDFDIDVDFMLVSEFEEAYKENPYLMNDYNMLILGFSDAYQSISGTDKEGPMSAIIDFIEGGKSVLFAHDTVSFFTYDKYITYNEDGTGKDMRQGVKDRTKPEELALTDQFHNSYTLTKYLRGLVGMDRYGITEYDVLKTGVGLTTASEDWNQIKAEKDMAYVAKSGATQTSPLTQGYTYSIINAKDFNTNGGRHETFTAEQTADGKAFTNTYLNLDYGTVYSEDNEYNDGEITGAPNAQVTNLWVTQVNNGQITDYPYKLKEEFLVSNTHAQYFQLDFMADDDDDGQSDLVVWYCLGYRTNAAGEKQETFYSKSPNDVSNNYYIYNKGNITYTGVGHAGNTSTVEEAKLFINTMIASYNAGIKDPVISTLSDGTSDAAIITSAYSYYDASNNLFFDSEATTDSGVEGKQKIYFTVSDPNFVKGERKIAANFFYESDDADAQEIIYGGKPLKVKELPAEVYDASTNRKVEDAGNLTSGGIYYILFDESVMGEYQSKFSVYFEAQSTINTYKSTVLTGKSYSKFDYTRVQLFDLQ